MRKGPRKEQILRRRNFLPSLMVTVFLWTITAGVIYFVDPYTPGAILIFFVLLFLGLLFTFSLLLGNARRGFIVSLGPTLFLILRYLGVGNVLDFLLIAGIIVTAELYFSKR